MCCSPANGRQGCATACSRQPSQSAYRWMVRVRLEPLAVIVRMCPSGVQAAALVQMAVAAGPGLQSQPEFMLLAFALPCPACRLPACRVCHVLRSGHGGSPSLPRGDRCAHVAPSCPVVCFPGRVPWQCCAVQVQCSTLQHFGQLRLHTLDSVNPYMCWPVCRQALLLRPAPLPQC